MAEKMTKAQIEDYRKLCDDRSHGRLLTPEGLRFICSANDYDPEKIGRYFLELLPTVCPDYK